MGDRYDVIVLGGGAVGENAAGYASEDGLSVALIERELVGGECSYWACMPSKALLRPGEVLAEARRVPAAAAAVTGRVDPEATFKSRDAFASGWDDTHQAVWVDSVGVDLIRGVGRLAGPRRVEVDHPDGARRTLEADRAVVLATGSRAAMPPVDGLADAHPWDNRDITTAGRVPERLVVLGGGAVGVEMAQAFHRLGAREVTVVELFDRLLAAEEPFAGDELRAAFEAEGIGVHTGTRAVAAVRRDNGEIALRLDDGRELVGDELLVATGRRPATDDLGLDTVGREPGGSLEVDDQLRVLGVEGGWLYAVGDVNGRALLTHQGKYQARILGDVLAGRDVEAWADHRAVPRVVFTDPQVAAVGLTERRAREAGLPVTVLSHRLAHTAAGALHGQDTVGTAQVVVDTARRTVAGATFTGPNAAELVHAATIAIVGGVTVDRLWHAVPAFPTLSEVWLRLLEAERHTGRT
ncbi:MAG: NAD(P)/FAD-dependent oxidoreductase [Actinobacteria bacterium]|nr:NAD(P)/FAD-dependent oxidoreductase [Actinomycetota bacterium]